MGWVSWAEQIMSEKIIQFFLFFPLCPPSYGSKTVHTLKVDEMSTDCNMQIIRCRHKLYDDYDPPPQMM